MPAAASARRCMSSRSTSCGARAPVPPPWPREGIRATPPPAGPTRRSASTGASPASGTAACSESGARPSERLEEADLLPQALRLFRPPELLVGGRCLPPLLEFPRDHRRHLLLSQGPPLHLPGPEPSHCPRDHSIAGCRRPLLRRDRLGVVDRRPCFCVEMPVLVISSKIVYLDLRNIIGIA